MVDAPRERLLDRVRAVPALRVAQLLGRLEPREQRIVLAGAGVVVILFVWLGVIDPIAAAMTRLDRNLAQARRQAASIVVLTGRYAKLRSEVTAAQQATSGDASSASLFAQLESVAVPVVGREHISSMNPTSRQVGDKLTEEAVEMHLDGTGSRELVTLLYAIERSGRAMRVARISAKRQYKNQALLDVTLQVVRLRPQ
jgi:type II secretory pathway component PulM